MLRTCLRNIRKLQTRHETMKTKRFEPKLIRNVLRAKTKRSADATWHLLIRNDSKRNGVAKRPETD